MGWHVFVYLLKQSAIRVVPSMKLEQGIFHLDQDLHCLSQSLLGNAEYYVEIDYNSLLPNPSPCITH
jgi:hypothetical protein